MNVFTKYASAHCEAANRIMPSTPIRNTPTYGLA
jgi:hypothetical protein